MDYFWAYCRYSGEVDHASKDGGGFFMTILLGIVGAVVGGWISTLFGFGKVDGFNFGSFRGCRYWCDCRAIYLQED